MLTWARETISGWSFVAFPLAIIFVFVALPTVAGVGLSMVEWQPDGSVAFIGLRNFTHAAQSPEMWRALRNSLIFAMVSVPLTVIVAFPLSVAINASWFVGRTLMRTIFFLPMVISIVAIGLLWRWVLESSDAGLLNNFLDQIAAGLHSVGLIKSVPNEWPNWLGNSGWGLTTIIMVSVWRNLGFAIVLYLAALGNVPQSSYDAAAVDGATGWQTMWRITWPAVWPMTFFLLITGMITALQVFDVVYVMVGTLPQAWTDVLNLYLYREFTLGRFGYAATIGVVVLLLTVVVTSVQLLWLRERGEVSA